MVAQANFFDPNNTEAAELRERAAALAMHDMLEFLDGTGQVAIYDATNSQHKRRQWIWNSGAATVHERSYAVAARHAGACTHLR